MNTLIFCSVIISIFCQEITFYVSPNGLDSNDGLTKETPWRWSWSTVSTKIRKQFSSYKDIYIIFLEGDYYVNEYGISVSRMSTSMYFRFWAYPGARVRIIGGIKLQEFAPHPANSSIYITQIDPNISVSALFVNGRRLTSARAPKDWEYSRLWGYYTTPDSKDSNYINRHYIVSEELIKVLSKLPKNELNRANIVCRHYYHTETDTIIDIDTKKNEIITNVTKSREDFIAPLPIEPDALYYVENVFNFLSEPNEYYISPNGTLYYYSEKGDNIDNSEAFITSTGWMSFHCNKDSSSKKGNFEVKNIEIMANSDYGVYISNCENITLINLTIHNCGGGISVQACSNITINHTYINDVTKYGQYLSKSDYIISHNNIIRNYHVNHGIEVTDCNNTYVTNNEIASGYTAPIMVKSHSPYDMTTIRNILIQDNHAHHAGYGVMNDLGGIQVLQAVNGLIIRHNHFHDIWAESYAAHGIYLGSATAGTICENNLVHDTLTSTFKMDLGMEITLRNNIWAYGGGSLLYWTTNKQEYHEYTIENNIFLVTENKLMGGGGWNNEPTNMTIDNNLYWHVKNGAEGFLFRYKNLTQWQALGYDLNSLIEDPMFTNHEKRDFTFKDKTNADKIGFKEFDFNFGVIGEDYWLNLANGKEYNNFHANQVLPPTYFYTSGFTDFDKDNDEFLKNCTINPYNSVVEKTNKLSHSGKTSLRFAASEKQKHSNTRPEIVVPCNYEQGHAIFSFYFYVTNIKNYFSINFDSYLYIYINNGQILNGKFTYEANKWNNITIYIDYGDAKKKSTYDIEVNGEKQEGSEIIYSTLSNFKISMIETKNDTYIDDLMATTDYQIPRHFKNSFDENARIFNTSYFEEKFKIIDNENIIPNKSDDKDFSKSDDDDNGLSTGALIGIICGLLLLIFICGALLFIFRKKIFGKNNINTEIENAVNNIEIKEEKINIEMMDVKESGKKSEKETVFIHSVRGLNN